MKNTKKIKETCCERCRQEFRSGLVHCLGITTCLCHTTDQHHPFGGSPTFSPDKMVEEGMTKKEFMKMLAEADVDDTTEFWESVYDQVCSTARKEERGRIKEIFNKCKTEKGLSRALSNYLTSNL